jgi:hypothetical protein
MKSKGKLKFRMPPKRATLTFPRESYKNLKLETEKYIYNRIDFIQSASLSIQQSRMR